jgi:glycosyltransferase involved in cell wall biosynthesis
MEKAMKILACQPRIGSGGQQNAMMGLCHGLSQLGHEVWLCGEMRHVNPLFLSPGINYVWVPLSRLRSWFFNIVTRQGRRTIERLHEEHRFDAVLLLHPACLPLATLAESRWKVPATVCFFGLTACHQAKWFEGPLVANCEHNRDWIAPRTGRRPQDLPVMIAPFNFAPYLANPPVDWRQHEPGRIIGVVGRLSRSRIENNMIAVQQAVEAADILLGRGRSCEVLIAGDGLERPEAERLAAGLNARHGRQVVRLCGHVRDMPALYRRLDVVLGVAGCILEGMASARPAFIVGPKGFADRVEAANAKELERDVFRGMRIDKGRSSADLADSLEEVLWEASLHDRISRWSRQHMQQNYGMINGARKIVETIEKRRVSLAETHASQAGGRRLRRAHGLAMTDFLARGWAGLLLKSGDVRMERRLTKTYVRSSACMFETIDGHRLSPLPEFTELAAGSGPPAREALT